MTSLSDIECSLGDTSAFRHRFMRDGALLVKGVLDTEGMALVETAYNESLANLADYNVNFYPGEGQFLSTVDDSSRRPSFQKIYQETPVLNIARAIFGSDDVWHYEDQLFYKEGGESTARRTPWHQDTSYHPMAGEKIAVLWMPLDDVTAVSALEVIPGTHKGTVYNGSLFDPTDDTTPIYSDEEMERLPDIQAERDKWDIVTCVMNRGDVLVFNTSTLHGGGPTPPGARRRSLSLRLVGDDVVRVKRPKTIAEQAATDDEANDETRAAGYDREYELQTRLTKLAEGEFVHKAGLTKL